MTKHLSTTHQERFYHLNADGALGYQRHTVFFRLEGDGWHVSASHCMNGDNFSRAKGRTIARRRYFAGKRVSITEDPSFEIARDLIQRSAI